MPQIRSEWNTVTDAKTARKKDHYSHSWKGFFPLLFMKET